MISICRFQMQTDLYSMQLANNTTQAVIKQGLNNIQSNWIQGRFKPEQARKDTG